MRCLYPSAIPVLRLSINADFITKLQKVIRVLSLFRPKLISSAEFYSQIWFLEDYVLSILSDFCSSDQLHGTFQQLFLERDVDEIFSKLLNNGSVFQFF